MNFFHGHAIQAETLGCVNICLTNHPTPSKMSEPLPKLFTRDQKSGRAQIRSSINRESRGETVSGLADPCHRRGLRRPVQ